MHCNFTRNRLFHVNVSRWWDSGQRILYTTLNVLDCLQASIFTNNSHGKWDFYVNMWNNVILLSVCIFLCGRVRFLFPRSFFHLTKGDFSLHVTIISGKDSVKLRLGVHHWTSSLWEANPTRLLGGEGPWGENSIWHRRSFMRSRSGAMEGSRHSEARKRSCHERYHTTDCPNGDVKLDVDLSVLSSGVNCKANVMSSS